MALPMTPAVKRKYDRGERVLRFFARCTDEQEAKRDTRVFAQTKDEARMIFLMSPEYRDLRAEGFTFDVMIQNALMAPGAPA